MSFILQDSSSGLWQVDVDDNGDVRTTSVGSGSPITLNLNDPGGTTSWSVGVTTIGQLTTTSVTFNAANKKEFTVVSNTGKSTWFLKIHSNGDLFSTGLVVAPNLFLAVSTN